MALLCLVSARSSLADAGFWRHTSDEIPSDVRNSATRVLRIIPQYNPPKLVDTEKSAEILTKIEPGILRDTLSAEFAVCEQEARSKCPIRTRSIASAFLLGDRRTLVTAAHVFDDELAAVNKHHGSLLANRVTLPQFVAEIRKTVLNFSLQNDASEKILKDTRENVASIFFINLAEFRTLLHENPDERGEILKREKSADHYLLGDLMFIHLQDELPWEPIALGDAKATGAHDPIFYAGYPSTRVSRKEFNGPDASGYDLNITRGHAIANFDLIDFANKLFPQMKIPRDSGLSKFYRERLWGTTVDSSPGMSGGPALDRFGKVIGVATNASRMLDRGIIFSFLMAPKYFRQQLELMRQY